MSAVIGGNFTCIHGIDTDNVNEWNEHCSDPANGHTEQGTTQCIDCKQGIAFEGIPYHKITPEGKKIELRCPTCMQKYISESQNQNVVVSNIGPNNEVVQ